MTELTRTRRDDYASAARRRTSQITLSLSPGEVKRMRQAALACLAFDVVDDADGFVAEAQRHISVLPDGLVDCLRAFRRHGSATGGLLIRGLPTFEVPRTPDDPHLAIGTRVTAAGLLGVISAVVGDQYGFRPELNGRII
jgi:hypothetical protein